MYYLCSPHGVRCCAYLFQGVSDTVVEQDLCAVSRGWMREWGLLSEHPESFLLPLC